MPSMTAAQFRAKHVLERDVARQVRDFMELRRWRRVRNQSMVTMGAGGPMTIGEKGMADLLYIQYLPHAKCAGLAVLCWIETKRAKGGRRHDDQVAWHEKERRRGAITLFVNDLDEFRREYEKHFGWLHGPGMIPDQRALELVDDF